MVTKDSMGAPPSEDTNALTNALAVQLSVMAVGSSGSAASTGASPTTDIVKEAKKEAEGPAFVVVDTIEKVESALRSLRTASVVAFDAEGVSLCRDGPLTVASFLDISSAPTLASSPKNTDVNNPPGFLFDVVALGKVSFISAAKSLLESPDVLKVSFDCRTDSDALWHQFGIKLTNVLDLQVSTFLSFHLNV